jgi:hypothetical protein
LKKYKIEKRTELELDSEQIGINHSGGVLSLSFAGIGALGALLGGGVAIANSVIEAKHKTAEEEEILVKRHNKEMERLATNARSLSIGTGKKKVEIQPLSNFDILKMAKEIENFRGVFYER